MKFVEYIALKNDLEKDGSNVNEFVKEITGEPLNELYEAKDKDKGGDEIETSRAGKGFHSPKFAMKRKKLNNLAKQFLKSGKEKVIAKYAPKILQSTADLITKSATLAQEGKNPEEINKLLAKEAEKGLAIQDKSIARLDQIIDKMAAGFDKRVQKIIAGDKDKESGLSEKSQTQLDVYWGMLTLQVRQALDKALVKYREDMIEKAVSDNQEMDKMLKLMTQSPNHKQKMKEYQQKIEDEKQKYKNAGEGEEKKEFKVGEKYQYTTKGNDGKPGRTTELEIIEVTDDGTVRGKTEKQPKGFVIRKDAVGKKIKDAEEAPKPEPAAA